MSEAQYRIIAVAPKTSRCLVVEYHDDPAWRGIPRGRWWLVTPHWRRVVSPVTWSEAVLHRRGWLGDMFTPTTLEDAPVAARRSADAWNAYVHEQGDYNRSRDKVGRLRWGVSPRRSVAAYLARRTKQARVSKTLCDLHERHRYLCGFRKVDPQVRRWIDAGKRVITAAFCRAEGKSPPRETPEELRERVRARLCKRLAEKVDARPSRG